MRFYKAHEDGSGPKGVKDQIDLYLDAHYDELTAKVRQKWFPRWMQITGASTPEDIDFDNPYVHLEWILCDMRIQSRLMDGNLDSAFKFMDDRQI